MDETVVLEEICTDKTMPYDVSYMSTLLVSLCTPMPTVSLQQNVTFNLFFFFFSGDIKIVLESSASYLYRLIFHLCNNPILKSSSSHWLLSAVPANFCCSTCLPKLDLLLPLSSWQLKGSSGEILLSQVLPPLPLRWRNSWHKKGRKKDF